MRETNEKRNSGGCIKLLLIFSVILTILWLLFTAGYFLSGDSDE